MSSAELQALKRLRKIFGICSIVFILIAITSTAMLTQYDNAMNSPFGCQSNSTFDQYWKEHRGSQGVLLYGQKLRGIGIIGGGVSLVCLSVALWTRDRTVTRPK